MKTTIKSLLSVVALIIGVSLSATAQFRFGVTAGANFSDVVGDESSDNIMKIGFHAGLDAEFSINDRYSIVPSVLYTVKGTKSDEFDDLSVNINYIEVPLAIKYQTTKGIGFWIGPYFGILTSATLKYDNEDTDVSKDFNDVDAGVKLGIGYRMKNGLGFYSNYALGITNIDHFDNADLENQNSVFGLGVSYLINPN